MMQRGEFLMKIDYFKAGIFVCALTIIAVLIVSRFVPVPDIVVGVLTMAAIVGAVTLGIIRSVRRDRSAPNKR